jgi:mono/diheme cytochrome c family protein
MRRQVLAAAGVIVVANVAGVALVVSACSSQTQNSQQTQNAQQTQSVQSTAAHGKSSTRSKDTADGARTRALLNGEEIFRIGKDIDGVPITATQHPLFKSCAGCHRADGSGGKRLAGGVVSADLRYAALVTHQQPPYALATLERAIATGIDNKGKPLDPVMPRWKLSRRDLQDVAEYVITLK